jgi:predicted Zn-dependent peptidase
VITAPVLMPRPSVAASALTSSVDIEEHTLANGLRLAVLPRDGTPVTAVHLGLFGGAALDGERHGASYLAHVAWMGNSARTLRPELAEYLIESGSDFDMAIENDHVRVSIVGAEDQLDDMLEFLGSAQERKAIDEEIFDERVGGMLDAMWEIRRSPAARAMGLTQEMAFGSGHPYGHLPIGRRETLAKVSRKGVDAHLRESLCPDRAFVVVSGPLRMSLVRPLVERRFGKWQRCGARKVPVPAGGSPARTRVPIIHDGRRAQVLFVGAIAFSNIQAGDVDEIEMLGDILGGSFGARLQSSLRGEAGSVYGVWVGTDVLDGAALLRIQTSLDPEKAGAALRRILAVIESLTETPPTQDEVDRFARQEAVEMLAMARSPETLSLFAIDRMSSGLPVRGRTTPTPADLAAFAAAHFAPERLHVVLAGDSKALAAIVTAEGLGQPDVIY